MRIIRFLADGQPRMGVQENTPGEWIDLTHLDPLVFANVLTAHRTAISEGSTLPAYIREKLGAASATMLHSPDTLSLLPPIEAPEVWAAGVTYERSRQARNAETQLAESVYDKVYVAERPELFFKATGPRVVSPDGELAIRSDSSWMIPEPELAVVLGDKGSVIGYTIGNDMSSRDIEGENPLYLPQAKVYRRSCSFGPAILLEEPGVDPYDFTISLRILRGGHPVVEDQTSTRLLRRKIDELVGYLLQDNDYFPGTVLLTGTGVVPRDDFSLQVGDVVEIEIDAIGVLRNPIGP